MPCWTWDLAAGWMNMKHTCHYGHGAKDLTPEEIQEQFFNLGRCRHDKKLFEKFASYLEGLRKAA